MENRDSLKKVYDYLSDASVTYPHSTIRDMTKLSKFQAEKTPKEHVAFLRVLNFYFSYIDTGWKKNMPNGKSTSP